MRIMPDGRIGIFDFGMVGKLSNELKQHMVNALMHVIQRDYRALIDDFVGMGFLSAEVDRESLFADLSPIIEARFAEGMTKVRFRKMLFDFSDVCWRYPFRLPSEFTYVMRALLTLRHCFVYRSGFQLHRRIDALRTTPVAAEQRRDQQCHHEGSLYRWAVQPSRGAQPFEGSSTPVQHRVV